MSVYGEDGSTGYDKEDMYAEIREFLEDHTVSELMEIISDVLRAKEL